MRRSETALFISLMAALVPMEILCARAAHETLGEVTSALYFMAVGLNLPFLLLAIRSRAIAALGATVLAVSIIPYQLVLTDRLFRVQAEAARIVSYVYEQRLIRGDYPVDLSDYAFHDPGMAAFIQEYRRDEASGGFYLAYRVGTESTSHTYTPKGGWGYYPD
jgi:hypothetical protein